MFFFSIVGLECRVGFFCVIVLYKRRIWNRIVKVYCLGRVEVFFREVLVLYISFFKVFGVLFIS